jgi:hypothetical protein
MLQFTGNPNHNLIHNAVHLINNNLTSKLVFQILGMVLSKDYHAGTMDRHLSRNVQFKQAKVSPIILQLLIRKALSSGMLMFLG